MPAQLIVEFSDPSFRALVVAPDGRLLPCSQIVQGTQTRYFGSEILFDPRVVEDPDFLWDEALGNLPRTDARTFFQRTRHLGLRRPSDLLKRDEILRLRSPLAVLSSPAALADPIVQPILPAVAVSLLDALLEPIFADLHQGGFLPLDTEAFAIVPAPTGRRVRLALQKVFRRRGFRRLTILPRELAASLALLERPPGELLVWDVAGADLHLHRVAMSLEDGCQRFATLAARTVRGLGWSHWVRQIAAALTAAGRIPDPPGALLPALDRALTGLLSGSLDPTELPTSPSLRLTHGLLEEVLDAEWRSGMVEDLQESLAPHLSELNARGLPVILLGTACNLKPLQELFAQASGGSQPPASAQVPVLERGARGVARALQWRREDPGCGLTLLPGASLRLDSLHGETYEIVPSPRMPGPGEEIYAEQSFRLAGDSREGGPFLIHLLWGADPTPEGNASVGVLPLEIDPSAGDHLVRLRMRMRRSTNGRLFGSTIRADLQSRGDSHTQAHAFFMEDLATSLKGEEGR